MGGEDDQIGMKLAAAAVELEVLRDRFAHLSVQATDARHSTGELLLSIRTSLHDVVVMLASGKASTALDLLELNIAVLDEAIGELNGPERTIVE